MPATHWNEIQKKDNTNKKSNKDDDDTQQQTAPKRHEHKQHEHNANDSRPIHTYTHKIENVWRKK